jgi:hypothetical protein
VTPREPRDRSSTRTATWVAAGGALIGAATLLIRRNHFAQIRALAGARYDEASGRGRPATPASPVARTAGHETVDMRGGLMAKLFLLLGSVAVCVVFAMVGLRLWVSTVQRDSQPPLTREQTAIITPPLPHLQRAPLAEIAALERREDALLDGYAYVDADRTHARIPIDRAMALTIGQPLAPPP